MSSPPDFRRLQVEPRGEVLVVRFTCPSVLEEDEAQAVGEQLLRLEAEGHRRIVVDLAPVERIGSTTIAKLVRMHLKVRDAGGRLVFCALQPRIAEIFDILQLRRLLQIYATEQEALQSFQSG
jgi:anti-anti-sigma factor